MKYDDIADNENYELNLNFNFSLCVTLNARTLYFLPGCSMRVTLSTGVAALTHRFVILMETKGFNCALNPLPLCDHFNTTTFPQALYSRSTMFSTYVTK